MNEASSPQLNLVVLRSENFERAAEFYRALGLRFTRHAHGTGPEHYSSENSGFVFEIYPLTPKSKPTTGVRMGFRVASVDEALARLVPLGAQIAQTPADSEWGRRAVIKDPDGHVVELLTPSGD